MSCTTMIHRTLIITIIILFKSYYFFRFRTESRSDECEVYYPLLKKTHYNSILIKSLITSSSFFSSILFLFTLLSFRFCVNLFYFFLISIFLSIRSPFSFLHYTTSTSTSFSPLFHLLSFNMFTITPSLILNS